MKEAARHPGLEISDGWAHLQLVEAATQSCSFTDILRSQLGAPRGGSSLVGHGEFPGLLAAAAALTHPAPTIGLWEATVPSSGLLFALSCVLVGPYCCAKRSMLFSWHCKSGYIIIVEKLIKRYPNPPALSYHYLLFPDSLATSRCELEHSMAGDARGKLQVPQGLLLHTNCSPHGCDGRRLCEQILGAVWLHKLDVSSRECVQAGLQGSPSSLALYDQHLL